MLHHNTPALGFERINDATIIRFISVDSALDFDTSNQSKLNFWERFYSDD